MDDARLESWIGQPRWPGSLAVATTCSCDVSRLGTEIRDHLNEKRTAHSGAVVAFDREAIRHLAGNAVWRKRILAAPDEPPVNHGCDYEAMIRGISKLGGAVLAGQCCFDATRGLNGVFRVMVSSCGHCRTDEPAMRLDPNSFTPESLVHAIADSFADWCLGRIPEPASKVLRPKEFARPAPVPVGA